MGYRVVWVIGEASPLPCLYVACPIKLILNVIKIVEARTVRSYAGRNELTLFILTSIPSLGSHGKNNNTKGYGQ
jgi:hypothetical protein